MYHRHFFTIQQSWKIQIRDSSRYKYHDLSRLSRSSPRFHDMYRLKSLSKNGSIITFSCFHWCWNACLNYATFALTGLLTNLSLQRGFNWSAVSLHPSKHGGMSVKCRILKRNNRILRIVIVLHCYLRLLAMYWIAS